MNHLRSVIRVIVCGFGLLFAFSSYASIRAESYGTDTAIIFIEGTITDDDLRALLNLSKGRLIVSYELNSKGGDYSAALQIGRYIRSQRALVHVGDDAKCLSSCALIYIAGVSRSNEGVIGLHRPYLSGTGKSPEEIEKIVPKMIAELRAYVRQMGVTDEFANVMVNTPPDSMRIYAHDEIERLVPAHDPVYDEIQASHDARLFGLTTDEYRRRKANEDDVCPYPEGDASALEIYERVQCKLAFMWGLSKSDYEIKERAARAACSLSQSERETYDQVRKAGGNASDLPSVKRVTECRIRIMRN